MKRTRATALVAALVATALAVTACSSDSSSTEAPSSAPSSAASAVESSASSAASAVESSSAGASSADLSGIDLKGTTLKIGSANFAESVLLGDIYAAALKAKGADVSTTPNIGSRDVYLKALQDGSVDLVPEYSGALLAFYDSTSTAVSSADIYAALPAAVGADLKVLDQSSAEDKDSITVTKDTADKYSLKSIGDLAAVAKDLTLGGAPEFQTRADGVPGLEKVYGVTFGNYTVLDAGGPLTVNALKSGQVDAADVFTTDPSIEANGFVVLDDPENLYTAQNVLPLISAGKSTPDVDAVLNAVSAALTTEILAGLDEEVGNGKASADVAAEFVASAGIK